MTPMVETKRLSPDDGPEWRAVRLRALEEAPYAFGSTLAAWQGEHDTEARWRDRLENVPLNVVAWLDGCPAGQVAGTAPDPERHVELISMWVAPEARGRGVADALIATAVQWARERSAVAVVLWVRRSNPPAIATYERNGFAPMPGAVRDGEQEMQLRL